ncbi:uncharacterized protein LOC142341317 [Convolutriloba macropyga]|uniref:uncharacterized protein LOC142341317 n=1 Tax=Convolutriloba macropyga TaxID=536237 RepID=UPI003F528EEF
MDNLSVVENDDKAALELEWQEVYSDIADLLYGFDVFSAIISIFGCFGNLLTMQIISKWSKLTSGGAFMYSLALADFMSVFYDGILEKLLNLFGIRISGTNSATCAIFTFYSWPEVSTILHGFVPVFLVFLFTVLTVVKLMSRSAEISRNNNRSGVSRKEREMTKQMIVVCIIFTIFALIGTGSIRFMFETSVATLRDEALFNVASGVVTKE